MLLTKNHIFCRPSWISCHRKKCSTLTSWHTSDFKSASSNWPESIKKHYICRKTRLCALEPGLMGLIMLLHILLVSCCSVSCYSHRPSCCLSTVYICVCVCVNNNHWIYHHQTWEMDDTWHVLVIRFICSQKVKCQGHCSLFQAAGTKLLMATTPGQYKWNNFIWKKIKVQDALKQKPLDASSLNTKLGMWISRWQVQVIHFIWGQKVKCQGRREFALFWVSFVQL